MTSADTTHGSPSRTARSRRNSSLPLCRSDPGANSPATKKNAPMTNSPDWPTTIVSATSTPGATVTSLTSSYGQPPTTV
jgi:hypothetical protein